MGQTEFLKYLQTYALKIQDLPKNIKALHQAASIAQPPPTDQASSPNKSK